MVSVQEQRNLFRLFPVAGIDNSRPVDALQDVEQFAFLVFRMAYHVGQVLPLKAHAEHIFLAELKALLDIADHFRSGSGRQCDDGNSREQLTYIRYFQVSRAEVISPLRDAV